MTDIETRLARIEKVLNLTEKPQEEWPYTWVDSRGVFHFRANADGEVWWRMGTDAWEKSAGEYTGIFRAGLAAGRADGYEAKYKALCEAVLDAGQQDANGCAPGRRYPFSADWQTIRRLAGEQS